jgi:hypothetical protein
MPLPLTKEIEDCQAHAAHCARQAKTAACPNIREDFLRLEQNWLQLARSYQNARQIMTAGTIGSARLSRPNEAPARATARLDGSAGMLLELALDAVGGRAHVGLKIVPVFADYVPVHHRRFAAGRACRQAIAGASGR